MDNLTHSLVGALIGQAGLKRRTGLAEPARIRAPALIELELCRLAIGDGLADLGVGGDGALDRLLEGHGRSAGGRRKRRGKARAAQQVAPKTPTHPNPLRVSPPLTQPR